MSNASDERQTVQPAMVRQYEWCPKLQAKIERLGKARQVKDIKTDGLICGVMDQIDRDWDELTNS